MNGRCLAGPVAGEGLPADGERVLAGYRGGHRVTLEPSRAAADTMVNAVPGASFASSAPPAGSGPAPWRWATASTWPVDAWTATISPEFRTLSSAATAAPCTAELMVVRTGVPEVPGQVASTPPTTPAAFTRHHLDGRRADQFTLVIPLQPGQPDRGPRQVERAVVAQHLVDLAADRARPGRSPRPGTAASLPPDDQAGHARAARHAAARTCRGRATPARGSRAAGAALIWPSTCRASSPVRPAKLAGRLGRIGQPARPHPQHVDRGGHLEWLALGVEHGRPARELGHHGQPLTLGSG